MSRIRAIGLLAATTALLVLSGCGSSPRPAARATATPPMPEVALGGTDSRTSPRFALEGGSYRIAWRAEAGQRIVGQVILRGGGEADQATMPIVALVDDKGHVIAPEGPTLSLPAGHYIADVVLMAPAGWTFTMTREGR